MWLFIKRRGRGVYHAQGRGKGGLRFVLAQGRGQRMRLRRFDQCNRQNPCAWVAGVVVWRWRGDARCE